MNTISHILKCVFQIYIFSGLMGVEGLMLDVTWWSVLLTLRLSTPLSLPVCLPLSICGVVDCEVLVLSLVLCFHISYVLIPTFAKYGRFFLVFFLTRLTLSSFLFLITEDTNWFPKENMFSFQTATTTMQA